MPVVVAAGQCEVLLAVEGLRLVPEKEHSGRQSGGNVPN
jgi:hypothetical protein